MSAGFTKAEGKLPAQLTITADIPAGWHIYSLTQRSGGPLPTHIKFQPPLTKAGDAKANADFILKGDFKADPAPDVHTDPAAYGNLPLEEHTGRVTWTAPIEFKPGVDPAKLEIHGVVNAQRCSDSCLAPKDFPFVAKLEAAEKKPSDKTPPAGESTGPPKKSPTPAPASRRANIERPGRMWRSTECWCPLLSPLAKRRNLSSRPIPTWSRSGRETELSGTFTPSPSAAR